MKKAIISSLISGVMLANIVPSFNVDAAYSTHLVHLLDYNGNVMWTFTVLDGTGLDLDQLDFSSLNYHENKYTQVGLSGWSQPLDCIKSDMDVQALYLKRTLNLESVPTKNIYYSNTGDINLDGLKITIYSERQLPEKDQNGNYKLETETVDITEYSTTSPANLNEAFKDSNSANIKVYPIAGNQPICTLDISFYDNMGDVTLDGYVDASDASWILREYSLLSTGQPSSFNGEQRRRADIDRNNQVDACDASSVLSYYAMAATTKDPTWEKYFAEIAV